MLVMPPDHAARSDLELWHECLRLQTALLPAVEASLRPPATEEAIAAVEAETGLTVPQCLKAGWRLHDGVADEESPAGFLGLYWLGTRETIEQWRTWAQLRANTSAAELASLSAHCQAATPDTVAAAYSLAGWLPVFRVAMEGDYVGVDLAPGPKGAVGQLINFGRDQDNKHVIAKDLRSFLGFYCGELAAGRCVVAGESDEVPSIRHLQGWFFDLLQGLDPERIADVLFDSADELREEGELESARATYDQVIALQRLPSDMLARALLSRGRVFELSGDPNAALTDYTSVIEGARFPVDHRAFGHINRSNIYLAGGDGDAALADLNRALCLKDVDVNAQAQALINRGLLHGGEGRPSEEIADYTRVVELDGVDAMLCSEALQNRGITHVDAGDFDAGIADYDEILARDLSPERNSVAYNCRSWAKHLRGDQAGFLADARLAQELDPEDDTTGFNLSLALLANGHDQPAMAQCRQSAQAHPDGVKAALDDFRQAPARGVSAQAVAPFIAFLESL